MRRDSEETMPEVTDGRTWSTTSATGSSLVKMGALVGRARGSARSRSVVPDVHAARARAMTEMDETRYLFMPCSPVSTVHTPFDTPVPNVRARTGKVTEITQR